jgi:hypothetical protein
MTVAEGGGIFISYRRHESKDFAGRLYDRLVDRFGESRVFIDVVTIELGVDFAKEISRALAACEVLVAVIGPAWLTVTDGRGQRRLDDPDDIVRLEIGAALARDVRVIPILVEGAMMPARQDLPDSLADLARRNALPIRHESFRSDTARLVTAIERVLTATGPGRAARLLTDAERTASSITSEFSKALALSAVAEALAATDPGRAARLLADAERTANSITDESEKASALSAAAEALAATDPDRAERIAYSITSESSRALALSAVAKALAVTAS